MRRFLLLILLSLSCGLWSCGGSTGGSETGNPDKISISVIAFQSSAFQEFTLPNLTVNTLTIDKAVVVLDRIHFLPFNTCIGKAESVGNLTFDGPFVVDLFQTSVLEELEDIDLPDGWYCRIKLRLNKLASNFTSSDSIIGRSFLIEGARSDGVPFQLTLEQDDNFELENEINGFQTDGAAGINRFFIAFDLDKWFSGVDLDDPNLEISVDSNADPVILINDDYNKNLRDIVIDNLKNSASLFEDKDDDQRLDAEELKSPLAIGQSSDLEETN